MKYVSTVFNQMLQMLPKSGFEAKADRAGANRYTKHFTIWSQLVVNLYAQASGKKSLRDIETGLKVHQERWYHFGLTNISRSTLARANSRRDPRFFEYLFYRQLGKCRDLTPKHKFRFKNPLYALDSSLINLCLSLYPWAKLHKTKGALKLHTLLDYRGTIPAFIVITDPKLHDVRVARESELPLSSDSILVIDRAYVDFKWLCELNDRGVFFVTRTRKNTQYQVVGQHKVSKKRAVVSDEIIRLKLQHTARNYPENLRLVTYHDQKEDKVLQFITNNFHLAASTIAEIYKARWEIELFFKWIKQNLKIKTFLGTSRNAVLTQIWTAMIYYLLLAYIKYQTRYRYPLLYFTRVIREGLFKTRDIIDLLNLSPERLKKSRDPCPQPTLF